MIKAGIWNVSGFLLERASRIIIITIIAKVFSAEEFGAYGLAFALFYAVSGVVGLSCHSILIRFYGWNNDNTAIFFDLIMYSLLSGAVSFLIYHQIGMSYAEKIFSQKTAGLFGLFMVNISFFNSVQLMAAYFRANNQYFMDTVVRFILPSLGLVISLIITVAYKLQIELFVLFWTFTYSLVFVIGIYRIISRRPNEFFSFIGLMRRKKLSLKIQHIRYGSIITLIGLVAIVTSEIERVLSGMFLNDAELGTISLALFIGTIPNIMMASLNPLMGRIISEHKEQLNIIYKSYVEIMSIIGGLLITIIALSSNSIIGYFGESYNIIGSTLIVIILISSLVNIFTGPCGVYLQFLGKEGKDLKVSWLLMLIAIVISYAMIKQYQLIGAAIAYVANTSLMNMTRWILVRRYYNIKLTGFTIFACSLSLVAIIIKLKHMDNAIYLLPVITGVLIITSLAWWKSRGRHMTCAIRNIHG